MSSLNDILKNGKGKLPEDKLIAYLEGRLSPEEQHEVEAWLADEGMEADALEGLNALPTGETKQIVDRLNHNLHKKLKGKKRRRAARYDNWAVIAIVVVLVLCIAGYVVLHFMMK